MARSTQHVLPTRLIDELDDALDLIGAVAHLLALATLTAAANDPAFLKGASVSRAAFFIESEATRLRHLIQEPDGRHPDTPTAIDDDV